MSVYIICINVSRQRLKPLVNDLLPRRRTFVPGRVHLRFIVARVPVRQVSLGVLSFSCASIIPRMHHNHEMIC